MIKVFLPPLIWIHGQHGSIWITKTWIPTAISVNYHTEIFLILSSQGTSYPPFNQCVLKRISALSRKMSVGAKERCTSQESQNWGCYININSITLIKKGSILTSFKWTKVTYLLWWEKTLPSLQNLKKYLPRSWVVVECLRRKAMFIFCFFFVAILLVFLFWLCKYKVNSFPVTKYRLR